MEGIDLTQLSASQQEALNQYTTVTNQELEAAIPFLRKAQWNVELAITKYFDGESPDPVADALAAQAARATAPTNFETLVDTGPPFRPVIPGIPVGAAFITERRTSEVAPRVVPRKPQKTKLPLLLVILLTPFNIGWRLISTCFRTVVYMMLWLPAPLRPQALYIAITPNFRSTTGRRMMLPEDTSARFIREFGEEYGENELPWFEGGITQAHDAAKEEIKTLLIILMSPEHDDTESFIRETLLSPNVVAFINDPANNIIIWGGNVLDSEALQVAQEYACTMYPFTAVVSRTPKEGSGRMGILKRLSGPMDPITYVSEIRSSMDHLAPDLIGLRLQRAEQEAARILRNEQDAAYERSLALDRERARQRREEEAAAAEAERQLMEETKEARMREDRRQQWRRWRAAAIVPEPAAGPGVIRLALKMPGEASGRVIRRFSDDATMEELYAFVECFDLLQNGSVTQEKAPEHPEGYEHDFHFRISGNMPRTVFPPSTVATVGATIGGSANLIVEPIEKDEGHH